VVRIIGEDELEKTVMVHANKEDKTACRDSAGRASTADLDF
jgi:hypothetical protein